MFTPSDEVGEPSLERFSGSKTSSRYAAILLAELNEAGESLG